MVRETRLSPDDFIYPLFVVPGSGVEKPISSLPGQFNFSVDKAVEAASQAADLGIPGVILFGIPERKDAVGSEAWKDSGVVQKAARAIKKQNPDRAALKKHFMHGVGHPLGLDVHDVGLTTQPMQAGWVMTVEPAIYIREEGFAVRLENDVLLTDDGPVDLMAGIPIEADAIEALMAGKRKRA